MIGFISALLNHYTVGARYLLTMQPEDVASGREDPTLSGWRAWALADALNRDGERERAMLWINAAIHSLGLDEPPGQQLLQAEVFATAGRMAFDHGDVGDSISPLVNAEAQWVGLCEMTDAALADASSADLVKLADQLRVMAGAVDPDHEIIPLKGLRQDAWLVQTWYRERLLDHRANVAADAAAAVAATHIPENLTGALRMCSEARDWLARAVASAPSLLGIGSLTWADLSVPLALLAMVEGNIQVEAGDVEGSIKTFGDAIVQLRREAGGQDEVSLLGRLIFNQGNSYLRLERYADARRNYEECDYIFRLVGEEASRARVQHADLLTQSRQQKQTEAPERLLDEARQNIIEAERAVATGPDIKSRFVDKAPIVPAYQLLLGQLASRGGVAGADDYLRLVAAMREPEVLANLSKPSARKSGNPPGLADRIVSPLQVLDAHLRHLPGTTVFLVQSGAGVLTYLALHAGHEALEDRLLLGVFRPEFAPVALRVIEEQAAELEAILTGRLSARSVASTGLMESCRAAWTHLPERLRECLMASKTILYAPDPLGNIDEIPLELFRTDDGWLAGTHVVARQATLRTLMEMLSPNRSPSLLSDRAYLVRAEDPPEFDPLPHADQELRQVTRCIGLIGLAATVDDELTTDRVGHALNVGYRVLHYVGHGIANTLSEGLPLSAGELVQPRMFSSLDGFRTPFLYLSACEVGRSRYVPGGRSAGLAARAVEKGAPAVVGALQAVPDSMGPVLSTAFYRAARTYPVGEALRLARVRLELDGYNPACLGLFVQYGDPFLTLSPLATSEPVQTRLRTVSWSTYLIRWLAARRSQDRDQCLARLRVEVAGTPEAASADTNATAAGPGTDGTADRDLQAISKFISEPGTIRDADRPWVEALCERISRSDLMGAAAVRLLLAMETLQEPAMGPDQAEREFAVGLQWSVAMHDELAWAAFATYGTQRIAVLAPKFVLQLLEESEGKLKAWAELAPEYAELHTIAEGALSGLRQIVVVDG